MFGLNTSNLNSYLVIPLVITLIIIYFFSSPIFINAPILEKLRSSKEVWGNKKPTNYAFIVSEGCMLSSKTQVVVSGDEVFIEKNRFSNSRSNVSIDYLFSIAEAAINDSYEYQISYNTEFGYPENMQVHWDINATDDNCFYEVSNFEVIDAF